MKNLYLLAATLFLCSCSDGGFEEKRDHFMSRYGFSIGTSNQQRVVLGIVQSRTGLAVPQVEVYVKDSPVVTLTNHMGAFQIGNLKPGSHQLIFINRGVSGASLAIEVGEQGAIELDPVVLQPLVTISGHVDASEAVLGQITIAVDGTPIQTTSNNDGSYLLQVPQGQHQLSAKHVLYQTFVSEPLSCHEDISLDIKLESYGFPTAQLVVDSPDGFVVRGGKVRLSIQSLPGVVYFRKLVNPDGDPVLLSGENYVGEFAGDWEEIPEGGLEFEVNDEAVYTVTIQVADLFGKTSRPISTSFFHVIRDESWRVIHQKIEGDLMIGAGEKVLFVGQPDRELSMGVTLSDVNESTVFDDADPPFRLVRQVDSQKIVRRSSGVELEGNLVVAEGAYLEGSLQVFGDAVLQGGIGRYVSWQGGALVAKSIVAENALFAFTSLVLGGLKPSDQPKFSCLRCTMIDSWFSAPFGILGEENSLAKVNLSESSLHRSSLNIPCIKGLSDRHIPSESSESSGRVFQVDIEGTDFRNSRLDFSCGWSQPGSLQVEENTSPREFADKYLKLRLVGNNFYQAAQGEPYLRFDTDPALPSPDTIDYDCEQNYFLEPLRLFVGMNSLDEWPDFFPRSISDPNER